MAARRSPLVGYRRDLSPTAKKNLADDFDLAASEKASNPPSPAPMAATRNPLVGHRRDLSPTVRKHLWDDFDLAASEKQIGNDDGRLAFKGASPNWALSSDAVKGQSFLALRSEKAKTWPMSKIRFSPSLGIRGFR